MRPRAKRPVASGADERLLISIGLITVCDCTVVGLEELVARCRREWEHGGGGQRWPRWPAAGRDEPEGDDCAGSCVMVIVIGMMMVINNK
jgi:hypothetical protein